MSQKIVSRCTARCLLFTLALQTTLAHAATPATAPAVTSAALNAAIEPDLTRVRLLVAGRLTDPAKRAAITADIVPPLRRLSALTEERDHPHTQGLKLANVQHHEFVSLLYLFGDRSTVDRVDAESRATDPTVQAAAQSVQIRARWLAAGSDIAAQAPVAADLERLDVAHPADVNLTLITYTLAMSANPPESRSHLLDIATQSMSNRLAAALAPQAETLKARWAAEAETMHQRQQLQGKPLVLTGTTVDGAPFTSSNYAGRVVLVDFWATWCGPCKAELPRVRALYDRFHDKGLEVVGISNDVSASFLKSYTAKSELPWVELFDAAAAADREWHPLTTRFGIKAIPQMFLIDRKGVVRSVTAREDMETLIPQLIAE